MIAATDPTRFARRLVVLFLLAAAALLVNETVRTYWPDRIYDHQRSSLWMLVTAFFLLCCLTVASREEALMGALGVLCGAGAVANLLPQLLSGAIPNYLMVGDIVFNLADCFLVLGAVILPFVLWLVAAKVGALCR